MGKWKELAREREREIRWLRKVLEEEKAKNDKLLDRLMARDWVSYATMREGVGEEGREVTEADITAMEEAAGEILGAEELGDG